MRINQNHRSEETHANKPNDIMAAVIIYDEEAFVDTTDTQDNDPIFQLLLGMLLCVFLGMCLMIFAHVVLGVRWD